MAIIYYANQDVRGNLTVAGSGTFGGDVSVEDNLYLTDSGTVRGKIQLNSSDRDDLDIIAVSLGSNMKFFTVDSERMRITSAGNVGIGTTDPDDMLEVYGSSPNIRITNTAETDAGIVFNDAQAGTDQMAAIKFNSSDEKLKFFVNDEVAQRMVIDTSGNVGIGTTSPSALLHVSGGTASETTLIVGADGTNNDKSSRILLNEGESGVTDSLDYGFSLAYDGAGTQYGGLTFNEFGILRHNNNASGSAVMIMNRTHDNVEFTGNVGIGTTNPGEKLEVTGNLFLSNTNSKIAINQNLTGTPSGGYPDGNNGPGQLVVAGYAASTQYPGIMTLMSRDGSISANQDLGVIQFVGKDDAANGYASSQIIGTSAGSAGTGSSGGGILRFLTGTGASGAAPSERMRILSNGNVGIGVTGATEKLQVAGNVAVYGDIKGYVGSSSNQYLSILQGLGETFISTGTTGETVYFGIGPVTNVTNISVAGTAIATNFILSSDETLKDKIKDIKTEHIDVNWKNFELISEPGVKRSGVIAQELEVKHPEFVRTDKDGLKSVAYIDLLITKIAELEARLEKAGL